MNTTPIARLVSVYRSPKEAGLYLYVDHKVQLEKVPALLLKKFGSPELAMTLKLDSHRKLARADVGKVLQALDEQGFYLQLPPQQENASL